MKRKTKTKNKKNDESDIIAISETRINSTNSHLSDHQMHGYTFYHCNSTTKAGGVALILKTQ